jgi:APA family basic amino acid/polyamine antiporter
MENHIDNHKISFFTVMMLSVNIMIGAGLFLGPPFMASLAGELSYLGWTLSAIIFLPIVMSITTLSELYPGAGGLYAYSKAGLGNTVGYLAAWMSFLGYAATGALQFIGMRAIIIQQFGAEWISNNQTLFCILFFITLFLLSTISLANIGKIQNFFTVFKLLPIIFIIAIFCFFSAPISTAVPKTLWDVSAVLPFAIFGYWGFEAATSVSHLVRGGKKTASRAILFSFLFTAAICTLFHFGLLQIMGADALSSMSVASVVNFLGISSDFVKNTLSLFLSISLVILYANAMYGVLNANSFLLWGIANDDRLYGAKYLKMLNKNRQPLLALAAHIGIAFLFVITIPTPNMLFSITNIGIISALILTLLSLFVIQRKGKDYKKIGITLLGFASCVYLFYVSLDQVGSPVNVLPFIALIILGFLLKRKEA